jgi:hypothetical protein
VNFDNRQNIVYSFGLRKPKEKTMRMSREGCCSAPDCNKKVLAKGLCSQHYQQVLAKKQKTNLCACGCGEKTKYKFVHGHHTKLFSSEEQSRRGKMNNGDTQRKRFDGITTGYRKHLGRHKHRIAAEEMLGRLLLLGEIVHHIDHDKTNNDPSNLQVMTQAEHVRLHMLERKNKC